MNPIDAVISWVDGDDPIYQKKLNDFCIEHKINKKSNIEPTRIYQSNEIYYCLSSLCRFAPWLRNIYLVTNQQIPKAIAMLEDKTFTKKIKIIDQNDLLKKYDITSPVFNSLSIEWLIASIDGLSEQFIYLNDDFFIIREVKPNDFFKNNQAILRGEWKTQRTKKLTYLIRKSLSKLLGPIKLKANPHRSWQEKSAKLAGWKKKFYLLPHAPFPLLKNSFMDYIKKHPKILKKNASFPFRHPDQVSSIPLIVHLDLKQEKAIHQTNYKTIMVNGHTHSFKKIISRLNNAKYNKKINFVCMQSIDEAPEKTKLYMLNWLREQIKTKY